MSLFAALVAVVSAIAGVVASIAGFGIGSLLTPLFALQMDTKVAVAAVSIPHMLATALRFWMLRTSVDRHLLRSFGVTSALGGLVGALLHSLAGSIILSALFGALLVFAGIAGLTGIAERMRFGGWLAWGAGVVSGLLGGLVGNQGGIRSAAMLGFDVRRDAFVATATAIGLVVDGARIPVYLTTQGGQMLSVWPSILLATGGCIAGTILGRRALQWIEEATFRRIVSLIVLLLGFAVLASVIGKLFHLWEVP